MVFCRRCGYVGVVGEKRCLLCYNVLVEKDTFSKKHKNMSFRK